MKLARPKYKTMIIRFLMPGLLLGVFTCQTAGAAILFQNDDYATIFSNGIIINTQNHPENVSIQFGNTLSESLTWDIANTRFVLNDNLRIEGNNAVVGQSYIADDHSAASSTGTINLGRNAGSWETLQWDNGAVRFNLSDTLAVNGGISATGNVNFTNSSEFHMREVPAIAMAACTTLKELVLDTSVNRIFACSAVGNPGTWVTTIASAADFEGVYGADAGKDLNTTNGAFSINTGTNNFAVDSNLWNVTAGGALDAATVTSNGLLTGLAGANISGATINFNASSNFATNIGTGTTTGQVSLGGGSNCVSVDSNTWDMSCAGAVSGLTGITSTGSINFNTASSFRIPQFAADPLTCQPGEQYYNTVTSTVRLCSAGGVWTGSAPSGTQYFFVYDTTTQTVAVANTFQDVTFTTNATVDGWTHTPGTATFTATVAGTFMGNMTARVAKNGGANTKLTLRAVKNGTEIPGSQSYGTAASSSGDTISGNYIFTVVAGDTIKIQMTGGTTGAQILPGGNGVTLPSIQFNVWRMK